MRKPHQRPSLRSSISRAFILAYKEDTGQLEHAMKDEGIATGVLRPTYSESELRYSRTIRCLLNHRSAWKRASELPGLTLIMEADFVPCTGFADLPLPFDPTGYNDAAWGFLYAGGPRIFRVWSDGGLQGHAACPVAYVVSPRVASWLSAYANETLERQKDLSRYSLWDSEFQWHIMGKGGICFMPFRHYGEHGGLANPEHENAGVGVAKRIRVLSLFGLGRNHHAEVLYAPLKFQPFYAQGSRMKWFRTRAEAKIVAWLKLFSGRVIAFQGPMPLRERLRVLSACFRRLCAPY